MGRQPKTDEEQTGGYQQQQSHRDGSSRWQIDMQRDPIDKGRCTQQQEPSPPGVAHWEVALRNQHVRQHLGKRHQYQSCNRTVDADVWYQPQVSAQGNDCSQKSDVEHEACLFRIQNSSLHRVAHDSQQRGQEDRRNQQRSRLELLARHDGQEIPDQDTHPQANHQRAQKQIIADARLQNSGQRRFHDGESVGAIGPARA